MKEVLKAMGGIMVAAVGAALVLLLLFGGIEIDGHSGVNEILGYALSETLPQKDSVSESEAALREIYCGPRPDATGNRVRTHTRVLPREAVTAVDADGGEAGIRLLAVASATTGEDVTETVYDGTYLSFPTAGIYELRMRLTDGKGAGNVCHIYLEAED